MDTLVSDISDQISRRPRPSRNQDAQKHLKYLSIKFPKHRSKDFDLERIKIASPAVRNVLKHSFSTRIQRIELQPHVFPYYAPYLRRKITELTFTRYGDYSYWRVSEIKKPIVYPSLGSFKHLKKLSVPDLFFWEYVQMARKIRGLEDLQITLSLSQISRLYTLFHGLTSLQNVNLKFFYESKQPADKQLKIMDRTWRFLKDLTRLQSLKTLTINAAKCAELQDQKLQGTLIALLYECQVSKYDLAFTLGGFDKHEWKLDTCRVLSDVDSLHLTSNPLDLRSKGVIRMKKRMSFVTNFFGVLSDLVQEFPNIQHLTLDKIDAEDMIYNPIDPNQKLIALELRVSFKHKMRTLKLMTWVADYVSKSRLEFIQIQLIHLHKDLFEQFVKIHNALCPSKTATYKLATSNRACTQFIPLKTDMLIFVTEKISKLISLKVLSLELCLQTPTSIYFIEKLFIPLQNLIQLDLILYQRNQGKSISVPYKVNMPIYWSKKLERVRLDFSKAYKFEDLMKFFKGVSTLKKLQVFDIRCTDVENMTKEIRDQILLLLEKCQTCNLR